MIYLTRRERFNAAHKLWVVQWSDEKNQRVFGKCANANWHGHNYELYVTVKGMPDPITGFFVNVKELGQIIRKELTDQLDHRNLNLDVPFIPEGTQTTIENLLIIFWQQLDPVMPDGCTLHSLKIVETENISAEYFGPQ